MSKARKQKSRAGRPSLGAAARSKTVSVKMTVAEHDAIAAKVAAENERVVADGNDDGQRATVSSYLRDCALDTIGLATFDTRAGD